MVYEEEQQQDKVKYADAHQSDDARFTPTPSKKYSVINSNNRSEAGAVQGGNFVNSSLYKPVFNIQGESMNDRLSNFQTEFRYVAAEQKKNGNTVLETIENGLTTKNLLQNLL